ncbi:MAG: HU family DNA-binding protein [Pseudomonadota bacterium]|nr:HU family DNA-binding protein [Pseudomonadota bacterium]
MIDPPEGRYNRRTAESIQIAATCVPEFKAGKQVKDAVNS